MNNFIDLSTSHWIEKYYIYNQPQLLIAFIDDSNKFIVEEWYGDTERRKYFMEIQNNSLKVIEHLGISIQ